MKTFPICFTLVFLGAIFQANAQQFNSESHNNTRVITPVHELGLRFHGISDFDFIYKKQKTANKFMRYRVGVASVSYREVRSRKLINFAFGLAVGREKRVEVADRLLFIHGWEPSLSMNVQSSNDRSFVNLEPGVGYVLGFQFDVSDKFYINMETIPSLTTQFSIRDNDIQDDFSARAGFNSNAVAVSLVYRFSRNK